MKQLSTDISAAERAHREEIAAFIEQWRDKSDCILAHTSGSTGVPKDIYLKKSAVRRSAQRTAAFFGLNAESRLHLCLSPSYIAGKMMIVRALETGCALTSERPSNCLLTACGRSERISLIAVVPSQLNYLIENADALPQIDNILVGGSPLNEMQTREAVKLRCGVYESYGMTETASHVALRRVGPASVPFRALPGFSMRLDGRGCLVIDSDDFGTLVTNDVAQLLTPKQFIILGRYDDAIISGGLKIFPRDVERAVAPAVEALFPGVAYCVCGVESSKWGHVPALAIEGGDFCDGIISALTRRLAPIADHKLRPARLLVCDRFPRTDSGKIIRRRLEDSAVKVYEMIYS